MWTFSFKKQQEVQDCVFVHRSTGLDSCLLAAFALAVVSPPKPVRIKMKNSKQQQQNVGTAAVQNVSFPTTK